MNEIILNYIVQAILGGASGYITNDYAINMLFKEYTPLKIGGIIKKTRNEFIANLSSMVENDIINRDKLQEILRNESFKTEFEELTADFYKNCLYDAAGSDTFNDIDGFDSTLQSTDILAAKIINEHFPELYKLMAASFNISDLLSEEQQKSISNSILSFLKDILNNTDIVENIFLSLYNAADNLTLDDLIKKDIYETVIYNSIDIFTKNAFENNNTYLEEIISMTGLENALISSKEIFYQRKIKNIINLNSEFLDILNSKLLTYVNSETVINNLNNLINTLFSYGKECNKTVFQLLDANFEENLKQYLISNIPSVTENIVNWINENSNLIDSLIEESIDEVIKESDGLKAKLLSTIKNTYFNNLSKKYSIVDKIIAYVEKLAEPTSLSQNISDKIIDILSNLTVKEFIVEAEDNNITPEKIGKFIINYINNNSEALINTSSSYISELEISKILPAEVVSKELKLSIIKKLKEIAASNTLKRYLSKKSIESAKTILSKELGQLLSEEKAKVLAIRIKEFIKKTIYSNEIFITKWIAKQITTVTQFNFSKEINTNLTNQINEEIYKNYSELTQKIKNEKISIAIDKLNSIENLAKNSSEYLRSYAIKNTDVILSGSIEAIVTDNLNKLTDDELVNLANDFIGRELRPIMYFGGVLGVIAGILLATFQRSPLNPGEINLANMVVYSFVGFITNVIAINMIFRPYKEKKFLSKIPLLNNFSLGYIVKNQKIFAKNTSYFIDNSLLNKKSISELFDKYKDKIENSFIKTIAENDYKTLSNLLVSNKISAIKSLFTFLKNKVTTHKNNISSYLYSKLNNISVHSLMNDNLIDKGSSILTSKLKSNEIKSCIYSLTTSEKKLENIIPKSLANNLINDIQINYYDNLMEMLKEDNFKNHILKYKEAYQKLSDKQIKDIVNPEKQNILVKTTAEKLCTIALTKENRDKVIHNILSLVNKSLDKTKTFEEVFDGKLKVYVDSHMPSILENLSEKIKNNIKDNKNKISLMTRTEIKNHLGFLEKGMYTLIGGDEIVDELLTKIIIVKIPEFMDDKKQELSNIANQLLEDKFYKTKVDVLYTGLNKLQLNELIDSYFNSANSLKIEAKINNLMKELFAKATNLRLNNILNLLNAGELEDILNTYNDEINAFTNNLFLNLNSNKKQIIDSVTEYMDSLLDVFIKSEFKDIFKDISIEDVVYSIDKTNEKFGSNVNKAINQAFHDCKNYLTDVPIGSFINEQAFNKFAEHYLMALLDNQEFETFVKTHFESIIDDAIKFNFDFVSNESKQYVLNIFTDSCINSLKRNLDEILKVVEFDKIAQEEIEKMEPKKIHEMFNSFGEKYFKTLMLYGFGGFVFGINMYVGFTLTIIKILSELFDKEKH